MYDNSKENRDPFRGSQSHCKPHTTQYSDPLDEQIRYGLQV